MAAMATAVVASAAVVAAGMLLPVMVVVIAFCVRVIGKCSGDIGSNCVVCVPADTAEQLDARLSKGHLSAAADAAADENSNAELGKQACQCAVAASVGVDDLCIYNDTVLHIVHLELCGVAEVLKDISVFVGYCNFHVSVSFGFNCFKDFLN